MHDFFLKDGSTFAAWVTAVATVVLVYAIKQTAAAQAGSRKERKRDEQFRRLELLENRFNSQAMISARVQFANEVLKDDLLVMLKIIPPIGRYVVHFLDQVARLCESGQIEFEDVDLAFHDYVVMIWSGYERKLSTSQSEAFKALERLYDRMQHSPANYAVQDSLTAAVSSVRRNFWLREASLLGPSGVNEVVHNA